LQENILPVHDPGMSQNYIAQREVQGENRYYVVVAENGKSSEDKPITDPELIWEIEKLLKVRREAGEALTRLLIDKRVLTASVHYQATIALGEGQKPDEGEKPEQE
jgi:hypothetical protein